MDALIYIGFFLILGFLIFLIIIKAKQMNEEKEPDSSFLFIKQKVDELKEKNYKVDKVVVDKENKYAFFINKEKKEIVYCDSIEEEIHSFKFNEIEDFEIIEDKNIVFKSSASGMVAGGLLYGGLGALAGANTEKQLIEKSYLLKIKIYFNNIDCPEINMKFLSREVKRSSLIYQNAREDMEKFASTLKVIVNMKK